MESSWGEWTCSKLRVSGFTVGGFDCQGEGGMIFENNTEAYTLPCEKQIASESCMYDAGNPEPELCDNLKGRGGGEGVQREETRGCLWPIHTDVWRRPSQYCNYPSVKIN